GRARGRKQGLLGEMCPRVARFAGNADPAGTPAHDATVRCVVMSWRVIIPLGRYNHAKRTAAGPNPPEWPKGIIARQDSYWQGEANMAEGNPMLALERGETLTLPPAI